MAVEKFIEGHYYRWTGERVTEKNRPTGWNCDGDMDLITNGEPWLCLESEPNMKYDPQARFEGLHFRNFRNDEVLVQNFSWIWTASDLDNFEDYTEIQIKANIKLIEEF